MKFRITFKDPDGFWDGVEDAVSKSLSGNTFFSEKEAEATYDARRGTIQDAIRKYVAFEEYITVEFDTTAGTATVVPLK